MVGQSEGWYQREGTVGWGSVRPCCMEAYVIVNRHHIQVGIRGRTFEGKRVNTPPRHPTSFSQPCNLLRWSSSEPFWTPIDATASRWRSIHWPTTFAFWANWRRSRSLFCWCAISCWRLVSRIGTSRWTSRHFSLMSYQQTHHATSHWCPINRHITPLLTDVLSTDTSRHFSLMSYQQTHHATSHWCPINRHITPLLTDVLSTDTSRHFSLMSYQQTHHATSHWCPINRHITPLLTDVLSTDTSRHFSLMSYQQTHHATSHWCPINRHITPLLTDVLSTDTSRHFSLMSYQQTHHATSHWCPINRRFIVNMGVAYHVTRTSLFILLQTARSSRANTWVRAELVHMRGCIQL